jgi:hypothetical protein
MMQVSRYQRKFGFPTPTAMPLILNYNIGTVVDQNKIGQRVKTVSQFKDLCSVTETYVSQITT